MITNNDAWIFIATTLLFIAILLHSLWTLEAMAGHLSSYRGGWGLRSPTRGTYALWEPLVVPRLNFCLRLQCLGRFFVFVFVNPWTGLSSPIRPSRC